MSSPLSSAIRTSSTLRPRSSIWMMACILKRSFAIPLPVENEVGDELGSLVVEGRGDVAVDAERDRDGRVAEALLYDARVDAALQGERRPRVSQPLQREPW